MFTIRNSTLRHVLWIDAATGLVMGVSHWLGSAAIAHWSGVPAHVVQVAATVVLAAASLAAWLASRQQLSPPGVRWLAAGNFAWVAASAWLAWGSPFAITPLGQGWVALQGLAVLVLAELEWAGSSAVAPPRPAV